jgi:hypothetical protein
MAKNIEESTKILMGVGQALSAANDVYVPDKKEKDDVKELAFKIIKRELEYLDKNAK